MGIIGGTVARGILRAAAAAAPADGRCTGSSYEAGSKLELLLGADVWRLIKGRTVLDFGCGSGREAIELARRGAARVIGVDIQEGALAAARQAAASAGVGELC